jgi:hypothetical protein
MTTLFLLYTLTPSEKNNRFPLESETLIGDDKLYITPFGMAIGDPELKVRPAPIGVPIDPKYQLLNSPWEKIKSG